MELTTTQKHALHEEGFVYLPGVVPRVMVDAALRAINASVGEGMPPTEMPKFRAQSYCPELQNQPVITGLLNRTPALALVASAIGAGALKPVKHGQIALRFPSLADPPPPPRPHIDGMHSPNNGVPEGKIYSFTALVGILLSDLNAPFCGNFTVWPGSHRLYERYFRDNGPDVLLHGMPQVELPPAHQIMGRAGDVVLCHYLLGHAAAVNVSPNVRYAVFFRLLREDHDMAGFSALIDLWSKWEGMHKVAL